MKKINFLNMQNDALRIYERKQYLRKLTNYFKIIQNKEKKNRKIM
jgi:hypothetical protein